MDNKAMIKIGAAVAVGAVVIWLGVGMLGGSDQSSQVAAKPQTRPNPEIPKQAQIIQTPAASPAAPAAPAATISVSKAPMTQAEIDLMQMQQATQTKYIAALEQLQMLLVQKDIAAANKDIANADRDVLKAKRESILNQKSILDMLAPPKTASVDGGGGKNASNNNNNGGGLGGTALSQNDFTVVSVSNTRGKWYAVLSTTDGKLYSVSIGDTLASDGSTVKAIDRSGVTLDKSGISRKINMASII